MTFNMTSATVNGRSITKKENNLCTPMKIPFRLRSLDKFMLVALKIFVLKSSDKAMGTFELVYEMECFSP